MYTLQNGDRHSITPTYRVLTVSRHGLLRALLQNNFKRLWLLLVLCIVSVATVTAQEITLDITDAPLSRVLDEIKTQSDYDVFYNQALLRDVKKVTIKAEKEPLDKLLKRLFEKLPVNYSIANKTIVVTPKSTRKADAGSINALLPVAGSQEQIKGRVLDYKNRPLAGVMIQYDQSYFYTYTNDQGEFSIPGTNGTIINFSGEGFTDMELRYDGEGFLLVHMEPIGGSLLQNVKVSSVASRKDPTTHIDLTNRSYMNLGQVLQGTVPGLTLQTVTSTNVIVTNVASYNPRTLWTNMTLDQFLRSNPNGQEIINAKLSGNIPSWMNADIYHLTTVTRVSTTVVPELRGVNSFAGNATSMLVVIDGFPKDGFPSDFPMNNVESVEVIKDPKELIKWGPRATTGIIMIRTKQGKSGQIQLNYSSNLYYTPASRFNREKLQLPNTADVLDYMLQADSMFVSQNTYNPVTSFHNSPASLLLARLHNNLISKGAFQQSWDSLGKLDNESQLRQLQQNAFSQSHNLSMNGGTRNYKFSFMGGYSNNQDNNLKGYNKTFSLNLNNSFNLLQDKLNISWLVYVASMHSRAGYNLNPSSLSLQPYQMLLDNSGNYVYDYYSLNPDANAKIMSLGYKNNAENILEDALINKSTTKNYQGQTRFNLNWKLLPGIQWNAAVYYTQQNNTTEDFYDKESSLARQTYNQYGEYKSTGINFYVPYGNIFKQGKSINKEWNVRTGLDYSRTFGKSEVSLAIGGGAASVSYRRPDAYTLYGYNTITKTGAPIFLPTPDPNAAVSNYYVLFPGQGATVYPSSLAVPTNMLNTNSRNINWNAAASYKYDNRVTLSGSYNSVYNPNYGQDKKYSVMSNYYIDGSVDVLKRPLNSWLDNIGFSTGVVGNKMPDLPVIYNAARYQQVYWSNYAIWVNSASPTQQKGQRSQNVYQRLKLALLQGKFELSAAYNTQKMTGLSSASGVDTTIHYVSASAKANLRNGLFSMGVSYSKSPEGQSQVNGEAKYNIAKESFFHSKRISTLEAEVIVQNVSPYQGLGLMMGTNASSGGSYSMATNSTFNVLPPKNINYEVRARIGIQDDKYMVDLRYYNKTTSGLNSTVSVSSDVASGLGSQVAYSNIVNKGVEFFLKTSVVKTQKVSYSITLNGAYNVNIAKSVPRTGFTGTNQYATAYRDGYSTSNIWAYKWAGLDNQGNPQIYNTKGEKTTALDSATLTSSLTYAGVLKAPWNGGLIQEVTLGQFFARAALTFSWGAVMKRYIPTSSGTLVNSALIRNRWKKPGDELYTDVPAMSANGEGTYRAFVANNSTNSITSADYVRLQEIMAGWRVPQKMIQHLKLNSVMLTVQMQNVAVWVKNKYKLDPAVVGSNGIIGLPIPKQYSCSLMIGL
ncbi:TonB-dependent Receptor Plug Domain [Filimonas lacunae]|uniref:TonB-dependent Receptor Plug Domain n=1 Tax=Filimonas lacunae TaxID=477680 RepID=A0A173MIS3_9BACT|nr:SusC/RagA family TonB-linked outer membrane protein [Filimonas lacunae]BAV07542.1 outer membrane protein [Filimonas lacunae]SIT30013.1 TonB-dependent Receptor Plug Domain [Filimonas lacunae]